MMYLHSVKQRTDAKKKNVPGITDLLRCWPMLEILAGKHKCKTRIEYRKELLLSFVSEEYNIFTIIMEHRTHAHTRVRTRHKLK